MLLDTLRFTGPRPVPFPCPQTQDYLATNANRAKVRKPWFNRSLRTEARAGAISPDRLLLALTSRSVLFLWILPFSSVRGGDVFPVLLTSLQFPGNCFLRSERIQKHPSQHLQEKEQIPSPEHVVKRPGF